MHTREVGDAVINLNATKIPKGGHSMMEEVFKSYALRGILVKTPFPPILMAQNMVLLIGLKATS